MVSQEVVPPMPSSHSGSVAVDVGQAGSTEAGAIIETSQKVSGPTVMRCPDDRNALKTPTFPDAVGPGQVVARARSGVRWLGPRNEP